MKSLVKKLTIFICLSIAFSGLTACTNEGGEPASNQAADQPANSPATAENASADKPKSDYPAVSSAIMQASFETPDGKTIKLEDYKGKVVLVNLWATWCGPCKAEMPELIKMQNEHRDKGFEVVGLNTDRAGGDDAETVNEFAKEMNLNYQLGWIEDNIAEEFLKISKFEGIPQSFLINREGQLTGVFLGGGKKTVDKMKETVAKIVAE